MYYSIQPPEELAGYVQHFWVLEGKASAEHPFIHRALAEHGAELIFYYEGGFNRYYKDDGPVRTFTSGLFAQSSHFSLLETTADFGLFGVYFYPYAIPLLLRTSASELSDRAIDLKTLLQQEGEGLEEKVMLAASNNDRVKVVSHFLTRKFKSVHNNYPAITSCIRKSIQSNTFHTVGELIDYCNLSRRQFERKFKEQAGFSPKDFLRLTRFNVSVKSPGRVMSLTKLAIDCGYYDQSHFIHDFTLFSGCTPAKFFKQNPDTENYRASAESRSEKVAIFQF